MDPQKQREIASKGGKAAHQKGTAHEFTTEEARVAGRKGGAASRARRSSGGSGAAPEQPPANESSQHHHEHGSHSEPKHESRPAQEE